MYIFVHFEDNIKEISMEHISISDIWCHKNL